MLAATVLLAATFPLHGVFVELEHSAGIEASQASAIVIANIVGYGTGGCPRYEKFQEAADLIHKAPPHAALYVGLVYERDFDAESVTQEQLDRAHREDVIVAREFLGYLKKRKIKRKLAGWYLAREVHNFTDTAQRDRIGRYLADVSRDLPKLGAVLIAPYFVTGCEKSKTLGAEETGAMFAKLVKGTKITHVLLQDGFSARGDHVCPWPDWQLYATAAQLYEEKIATAVRAANVQFWVDMEVFGAEATADRIAKQYAILPDHTPVVAYTYRDCRDKGINGKVCPK